jgi:isoquinoline 1-oxidoreductase alpha subunit
LIKEISMKINVNGKNVTVDADNDTPLLWVLRDHLNLTGTKYGCGIGMCGACTIHLDGEPARACITELEDVRSAKITTIENLKDKVAKTVQDAWVEKNAPQCGYCQSGQIMAATALLRSNSKPTNEEIDDAMSGNLCRCATYKRIKDAIKLASTNLN